MWKIVNKLKKSNGKSWMCYGLGALVFLKEGEDQQFR